MATQNVINEDRSLVPLKWVFLSIGIGISALVFAIGSAIGIGSWASRVSLGQEALDKRVSYIEANRDIRIRENEEFQKAAVSRLSGIEAKLDLLLRKRD